jgi:hypothetical protein
MVVYAGSSKGTAQDPNLSLYCSQAERRDLLLWSSLDAVVAEGSKLARRQDFAEQRLAELNAQCLRAEGLDENDSQAWVSEARQVLSLAASWPLLLNVDQFSFALQLLAVNPRRAFEFIVRLIRSGLAQYASLFSRALHFISGVKATALRLAQNSYSIGNLITAQRRWYLHHGSHPDDTPQPA